jgi:tetratricopeptide (TPR) repeat protein
MPRKRSHQAGVERKAKKATKKDRRRQHCDRRLPLSFTLLSGLDEAEDLLCEGDTEEACEVLEELARRYPRRPEVLGVLLDAYLRLDDLWSFQSVCQQLISLVPDDVDLWLALIGAALQNSQWATTLCALEQILEHWPDHPEAASARHAHEDMMSVLQAEIEGMGIPRDEGLELLLLHDEIGLALNLGDYTKVIQLAERLHSRWPTFAPALNNRSEAHFRSGSLDRAIADARRVLVFDAGNFHALGNLTRYLFINGAFEEARSVAESLKVARSESDDLFVKQAEALATLGDWPGILEVFQRAQECQGRNLDGLLCHFAGVAAAELGQHSDARKHWKRAIKLGPGRDWAQQNLADSKLPPGEQSGPWAFPVESWIPGGVLDQFIAGLGRNGRIDSDADVKRRVRKFLAQHPYLEKLVPVLLERGDPAAQEFAVSVASMAETPQLLSALRDFALGRRGTDERRYSAASQLVEANVIDPGHVRMWVKGELAELALMTHEITPESTNRFPEEVER